MKKIEIPEKVRITEDLNSYREQVMASLKENKEIYSKIQLLGLTAGDVKKNIGTILTYYEDNLICQNCPGINNCPKQHPCFEYGLTFDGKFVSVTRSPCRKANEHMAFDSCFIYHDFDDEWIGKTLSDVNQSKVRNPLIVKMVKSISGESKEWLYIRGSFNSGRSFISACFANNFAKENSNPVAFCDTPKLVEELKTLSIKNKELFNSKIEALQTCPLLVLDGFGNEYMSEFNFAQVIYPLLTERFRKGLLTVFTSDFSYTEVVDMYSSKVGKPRARQLSNIFDAAVSKEFVLDGIKLF